MAERDIIFDGKKYNPTLQSIEYRKTGKVRKVKNIQNHFIVERIGTGQQSNNVRILEVAADNHIINEETLPAHEIILRTGEGCIREGCTHTTEEHRLILDKIRRGHWGINPEMQVQNPGQIKTPSEKNTPEPIDEELMELVYSRNLRILHPKLFEIPPKKDVIFDSGKRGDGKYFDVTIENLRTQQTSKVDTHAGYNRVLVERIPSSSGQNDMLKIQVINLLGNVEREEFIPMSDVRIQAIH